MSSNFSSNTKKKITNFANIQVANSSFRDEQKYVISYNRSQDTNFIKEYINVGYNYTTLYNTNGIAINDILDAFIKGGEQLNDLVKYDNYAKMAISLEASKNTSNPYYEKYRLMLIRAIEAAKQSDNRTREHTTRYNQLLAKYNMCLDKSNINNILDVKSKLNTVAIIRPEILKYVEMGYKLVDADGHLIPIDMTVLAQILRELN